jgi:hypothetical protein
MARKQNSENNLMSGSSGAAPARRKSPVPQRAARAVSPALEPEAAAAAAHAPAAQPSREAVARLAYSYWEARGYQGGSPDEDWNRAERELLASAATV